MSYPNIVRKCSVCECCGTCDYEHELETGEISGDFSPLPRAILNNNKKSPIKLIEEDKTNG